MGEARDPGPIPDPAAPGGPAGGPSYAAPGVATEAAPRGFLPGLLRFFVVPLLLVAASVGVFAGLGALLAQGNPTSKDLVAGISSGGTNARWQAAQTLSNMVFRGEVDLHRDEALVGTIAEAFGKARAGGDDPRVIQLLAVLLGRSPSRLARPALEPALADGNPDVRAFVLAALAELGDPASLDAVLPRAEDLDGGVRTLAVYTAGLLAERAGGARGDAAAVLVKALGDPAVDVRWNAGLALARLGREEGADLVWQMLHRDFVRANLQTGDGQGAGLLGTAGPGPAAPEQVEERVVLNALSAAYRLRDRSMIDGVRELAERDPSTAVRDWALRTRAVLEAAIDERGAVPPRTWTASR